jgi:hypothetical protein
MDSLQALEIAFSGMEVRLRPHARELHWLDQSLEDRPHQFVITLLSDAGRMRRVREIVAEDEYAIEQINKLRAEMRALGMRPPSP